ncbi:ABC transporter substrate-binding protein [Cohnella mopanensis]|uniref:ABC transporter substrate-binding protein n=1 Tax=Cohnella mopanensis TaxID=2911966 RepID=UPI001EF87CAF|nr:extracellular solute-binding protein [Cohnella mopanensis]
MRFRAMTIFIAIMLFSILATGCQNEQKQPVKLKILLNSSESGYMQFYGGQLYEQKFPEAEIEYITFDMLKAIEGDAAQNYIKFIREEKPDVILSSFYSVLVNEGILLDMNAYIRKNKFDLSLLDPSVMKWLKAPAADGGLYGLAPQFSSSALYYNRSLFEKYGVPLPTDEMTPEELIQTARRFPVKDETGKPLYGFHYGQISSPDFYLNLINPKGSIFDRTGKMTMDTTEWKEKLTPLVDALREGQLSYLSPSDDRNNGAYNEQYLFSQGQVAMFIGSSDQLTELSSAPFDWGIVVIPHDRVDPVGNLYPDLIYSIYRDSPNADEAWKYVEYMNSEEVAKKRSKTTSALLTRTQFNQEREGVSLAPFFKLDMSPPSSGGAESAPIHPLFLSQTLYPLINRELDQAIQDTQSIESALSRIQTEGQVLLDQEWNKSSGLKGGE